MSQDLVKLGETLRSRWFSIGLHVGLWLLVLLVVKDSSPGGGTLRFSNARATPNAPLPVPVAKLSGLFARGKSAEAPVASGNPHFFATTHFVPRTPPPTVSSPTAPPPPPPTTWKLELTYQGFFRTGDGPKHAILRLPEKLVSIPVGSMVVSNLFVLDATPQTLTLTNTATQTNLLPLNAKQVIEVPLK